MGAYVLLVLGGAVFVMAFYGILLRGGARSTMVLAAAAGCPLQFDEGSYTLVLVGIPVVCLVAALARKVVACRAAAAAAALRR